MNLDEIKASLTAIISYININDPQGFKKVIDTYLGFKNPPNPPELQKAFMVLSLANKDEIERSKQRKRRKSLKLIDGEKVNDE